MVEWQVARLAAACNEVADHTDSAAVRREALRFQAAYATSSYAIQAGRSPLVQALDLAAMSKLIHAVWIEDGRAKEQFGAQAQPAISALVGRSLIFAATACLAGLLMLHALLRRWCPAAPRPLDDKTAGNA